MIVVNADPEEFPTLLTTTTTTTVDATMGSEGTIFIIVVCVA